MASGKDSTERGTNKKNMIVHECENLTEVYNITIDDQARHKCAQELYLLNLGSISIDKMSI